jgi:hypothetical protein
MSELQHLRTKICQCCGVRLDKTIKANIRHINDISLVEKLNSVKNTILINKKRQPNDTVIKISDVICGTCIGYAKKYGAIASSKSNKTLTTTIIPVACSSTNVTDTPETERNEPDSIRINIPRAIANDRTCVVYHKTKNLIEVPDTAYLNTFINKNIIIPNGAKCCQTHLNRKSNFHKNDLNKIEIVSNDTVLKDYEVKIILDRIRHLSRFTIFEKFSNNANISDDDCKTYTGFTQDQFKQVLSSVSSLRNTSNRDKSQALATYLFWLKTGLDYRTISTIFSIENFQSVGEYCESVRSSLLREFVPQNLGASHLSRDEWLTQNTTIPKQLFNVANNELILIADGTYIYTNKSKYNTLQRKQYSMQKHRHLAKPFVICTASGRIVDIYGLFPATHNDATIIEEILSSDKQNCQELRELLKPNDHILIDRGFRDSIKTLRDKYKLQTHMPTCIPPNQKQMTTSQANSTRFITKCRWPVEVINGKLKTSFRANDKIHKNVTLKHTLDDLKICAAFLNKFQTV